MASCNSSRQLNAYSFLFPSEMRTFAELVKFFETTVNFLILWAI
jgi:hypothetical protein